MPIDNRIFALARRAPRANRTPVNEYAGLGQGLQQLGQGLDTLITTQWRLHVRNESASLDNWLTEQMGNLQIEAVKQSKNPEEQMAHWQAGVKELEKDAVHMYDQDELMQNRWHNIFENKRIPGELRMRQQGVRSVKKTSITEFNAANANTFNAVNDGDISVDDAAASMLDRLNGSGDVFGHAETKRRSREVLHKLIVIAAEKNDVAYLGGLSKENGAASLPKLFQGKENAQNRELGLSTATKSFDVRWGKASAVDKIALAESLSQALDGNLAMVGPAFGAEYGQTLLEVSTLLVIPDVKGKKIYAELSPRTLAEITARDPSVVQDLKNAMPLFGDKLRPILDGLGRNRGTRLMQDELAKGVEKLAALLMVENHKLNGADALDMAIKRYFPYTATQKASFFTSASGVVVPTDRNYSDEQLKELDQSLKQQKLNFAEASVKASNKNKGDFHSKAMMDEADVRELMKHLEWKLIGKGHQLVLTGGDEDKLIKGAFTLLPSARKK